MKSRLLMVALLVAGIAANAQNKAVKQAVLIAKVDPRVELMAIMAQMAGIGGYDSRVFKLYADDVKNYFGKDSLHPAIIYLKKLGKENDLGFDAIARMAVHLTYPDLTPKVKFTSTIPEARWTKQGADGFIPLLKDFFRDTNFDSFFRAHRAVYDTAEKRFQVLLNSIDQGWFERFYGYGSEGKFSVYLGLLNGNFSYGPKVEYPDGREELYAVLSNYQVDAAGMPVYDAGMLSTVVHEFNHSFLNHLVSRDSAELKEAGQKIHGRVSREMANNFYPYWTISISESLVRAAVIRYQMAHDTSRQNLLSAMDAEYKRGFYWIEGLVDLMGVYEHSREKYPTFASFFFAFEAYLKELGGSMDHKYERYDQKQPKLIFTLPFQNGSRDIDPSVKEMTLVFNRPMTGWSFRYSGLGKEHYPIESVVGWDESGTQLKMKLKLKPATHYEMIIFGQGLRTRDGYSFDELLFSFDTK